MGASSAATRGADERQVQLCAPRVLPGARLYAQRDAYRTGCKSWNAALTVVLRTCSTVVLSVVAASSAILTSINVISFVIIGIIMLVLGNTMIMSARERTRDYVVFKTIGSTAKHMVGLVLGESLFISAIGGGLGLLLSFPIVDGVSQAIPKGMFPIFELEPITLIFAVSSAILVGIAASIFPIMKALKTSTLMD